MYICVRVKYRATESYRDIDVVVIDASRKRNPMLPSDRKYQYCCCIKLMGGAGCVGGQGEKVDRVSL